MVYSNFKLILSTENDHDARMGARMIVLQHNKEYISSRLDYIQLKVFQNDDLRIMVFDKDSVPVRQT